MKALVVGAGIGGLAAGIGLAQAGWDVVVHERADPLRASGSGLSLFANAFTALDVLGLGTRVRGLAGPSVAHPQAGQRTPDGRWLSRMPADAVAGLGIVHRQELHGVLTEALAGAGGELRCGSEVCSTLVRLLSGPDRGGPMPGAAGSSPDVGRLGPAEAGRDVDAALAAYDLLRRPRTTRIARSARLLGAVAQVRNPVGAALRNAVLRVLPPSLAAAQVRRIQAWSPPAPDARPTPLP